MFEQLLEAIARGLERLGIPSMKVLAGRPRDLEDVRNILLKNPGFDLDYVDRWLREFDRSLGEKSRERSDEARQLPPQA